MDELTAELAAAAWFESVRIRVMSASDLTGEREFGPGLVILTKVLRGVIRRLNPDLPQDTVEEVVRILSRPPHPTLIQNNRWFHALRTEAWKSSTATRRPARRAAAVRG
jgi:type I restriction enzyme, R subunit